MTTVPARYVQVSFLWSALPKTKELEPVFNNALDWARIAPNVWVLWTNTDIETWLSRIKPHLAPHDEVFICELNAAVVGENYTGWMRKWFWDWLKKTR